MGEARGGGRAVLLLTAGSVSVPVAGLLSAPILSQGLGAVGRGEVAAALAPNLVLLALAGLGLDQAMTFVVARKPHRLGVSLRWATAAVVVAGLALAGVFYALRGHLAAGDPDLARLMVIAIALALPALPMALLYGAAAGRQAWGIIAGARAAGAFLRLGALLVLLATGRLDVISALVVSAVTPFAVVVVFLPLLSQRHAVRRPVDPPAATTPAADALTTQALPITPSSAVAPRNAAPPRRDRSQRERSAVGELFHFARRAYVSSLAVMMLARASQLLVTPLSDVRQLGLLVVAITISDVPYILSQTLRDFVFSTQSAGSDVERLLLLSRTTTAITALGALVLGGSLPWWIGPVFGDDFSAAVPTTWLLLGAATLAVPGLMAGALLDGSGRPRVRATAMVVSLVVNIGLLVLVVPVLGAVGAGLANLAAVVVSTTWMVEASRRSLGLHIGQYMLLDRADVGVFVRTFTDRVRRRRGTAVPR